ncbi:hypothetical protein FC34_GL000120 [Lacticaseibacillus brantae DSM 23927]|uniref:Uncharacterized protein n=1 Tax=Lacticaseibacillus brantae DSM 23927 TaxID=1423727 RepID=A0A0R2AYK8_9LACO|nr:hypothetical protein FC34_GL000120 [Lacticaseibacillus brantae DSM 23927]
MAAALIVGMVIVFGISPSRQDLTNALHGFPFFLGLLIIVWLVAWLVTPDLLWWLNFNRSLAMTFGLLLGYSIIIQGGLRLVLRR